MSVYVLVLLGALAGFVDAIAGGGGVITLPTIILAVGPGATAIGTNKIVGLTAAVVALWVYLRAGHFEWLRSLSFALWVGVGSLMGSVLAPRVPLPVFKWLVFTTCPLILWLVWRKDLWIAREQRRSGPVRRGFLGAFEMSVLIPGLCCGFYDGIWGPGGGTFMFLSLLFFSGLPLLTALAAAKLANACSAGVALVSYASRGYVHWTEGFMVATGVAAGAFLGARHATRRAAAIVRPVLALVVVLLLVRLLVTFHD